MSDVNAVSSGSNRQIDRFSDIVNATVSQARVAAAVTGVPTVPPSGESTNQPDVAPGQAIINKQQKAANSTGNGGGCGGILGSIVSIFTTILMPVASFITPLASFVTSTLSPIVGAIDTVKGLFGGGEKKDESAQQQPQNDGSGAKQAAAFNERTNRLINEAGGSPVVQGGASADAQRAITNLPPREGATLPPGVRPGVLPRTSTTADVAAGSLRDDATRAA